MCVYSMVVDHYQEKWRPYTIPKPWYDDYLPMPIIPKPSEEIKKEWEEELKKLLERAKKYDTDNNQPDCELDKKKKILQDMADQLGIKIEFP